jgi:hypothetical protein
MQRTVKEQIKSGVRLGIGAGSFLIAAILLGIGMNRIVWSAVAPRQIIWREPIGWASLLAAAIILLLTADVWWQLLAGYMFVGCFKGVIVFVTGKDLFAPHDLFPRLESAGLTVFAAVTVALLFRFSDARPTIVDRIALTLFVFCFVWSAATARFSAVNPLLVVGLIVLLISSVVSWVKKGNRKNVHLPHVSD